MKGIYLRITRITAWQVDLPLHEGSDKWSGGKSVAVETDAGITGYGEVRPLGPAYLPADTANAHNWGSCVGLRGTPCRSTT